MLDAIFSLDTLYWILLVLYIPACFGLIIIVLLQKGKGTGFAGAFGVGPGSETVFGPRARQSLPVRLTYVAAAAFMLIALLMSMISGRVGKGEAPELAEMPQQEAPAASGLQGLGIGTGEAGAGLEEEPPGEGEAAGSGGTEEPPAAEATAAEPDDQAQAPAASEETPEAASPPATADDASAAEEQEGTPPASEEAAPEETAPEPSPNER